MTTQMHTIDSSQLGQDAMVFGIFAVLYFIWCFCLKCIVEKCGREPGFLIWVPIFNVIRLMQAAGLSGWLFILLFIPGVNLIVGLYMWVKICHARGKSGWLVLMIFIPILNLIFIPYLAFSE